MEWISIRLWEMWHFLGWRCMWWISLSENWVILRKHGIQGMIHLGGLNHFRRHAHQLSSTFTLAFLGMDGFGQTFWMHLGGDGQVTLKIFGTFDPLTSHGRITWNIFAACRWWPLRASLASMKTRIWPRRQAIEPTSQRCMCWGKGPLQWRRGKRYNDMKWLSHSNQKTDLKSFFSLRSVFPPSPCFWQGDGYHQGDVRQLRLRSPIWRLKPSFVQLLKITASSPWVCSEGFQALHGAQEMGETYNMMMELLLTAGSSSSSGGSSPDVVVGEIAKDRCYGMLCLQDEPLTSHGTPCPSKETKYETMFSWVCS